MGPGRGADEKGHAVRSQPRYLRSGHRRGEHAFLPVVGIIEMLDTVYHAQHYVKEHIPVDNEIRPLRR